MTVAFSAVSATPLRLFKAVDRWILERSTVTVEHSADLCPVKCDPSLRGESAAKQGMATHDCAFRIEGRSSVFGPRFLSNINPPRGSQSCYPNIRDSTDCRAHSPRPRPSPRNDCEGVRLPLFSRFLR